LTLWNGPGLDIIISIYLRVSEANEVPISSIYGSPRRYQTALKLHALYWFTCYSWSFDEENHRNWFFARKCYVLFESGRQRFDIYEKFLFIINCQLDFRKCSWSILELLLVILRPSIRNMILLIDSIGKLLLKLYFENYRKMMFEIFPIYCIMCIHDTYSISIHDHELHYY